MGYDEPMKLTFIVNGETFPVLVSGTELLSQVRDAALQLAQVSGRDFADFVIRDEQGVTLPPAERVDRFNFTEDSKIFLMPNIGVGGSPFREPGVQSPAPATLPQPPPPIMDGRFDNYRVMIHAARTAHLRTGQTVLVGDDPKMRLTGFVVGAYHFTCRISDATQTCPDEFRKHLGTQAGRARIAAAISCSAIP